jgi:hypothetical protein
VGVPKAPEHLGADRGGGVEVAVAPEELGQRLQGRREGLEPWWARWLLGRPIELTGLDTAEPGQVQTPQVSRRQLAWKRNASKHLSIQAYSSPLKLP